MPPKPSLTPLSSLIFASRWLQLPLYLGLIVAQGVYVFLFGKELWHLIHSATELTEQMIMLAVLGLIDVVMISNLLVMVIVGGYETFVSRLRLHNHPDQPEWLSHVNASVLKVKLALSIIGISSIHLLKTFIEIGSLGADGSKYTEAGVLWQTLIHCVFILSAIGIAWTDRLMDHGAHKSSAAKH
ncbi:TIGR00645 family protein [Stenotrophomonas sp. JC08]|uniref:TIGR00645 family protein n=1 Tax=Stenotrophomonas sp. JC08 TaxID=3445779 RepID=UPI003FA27090